MLFLYAESTVTGKAAEPLVGISRTFYANVRCFRVVQTTLMMGGHGAGCPARGRARKL